MRTQITSEFEALVGEVEGEWRKLFPRRLGYLTRTELASEHAVVLHVRRGDFEGHVELCCDWDRSDAVLIRAVASSSSRRLAAAAESGERAIRQARGIALSVVAGIALGCCWLAAGAQMPVVGTLMILLITGSLVVGGGKLGEQLGEAMAAHLRHVAELELQEDVGVQADLRRWNSLGRQLRSHRRALARGLRGAPFRRAALEA